MEKLVKLLNEYEKEVKKSDKVWSIDNDGDICRQTYEGVDYNEYTEYMNTNNLISKSFLFIQWLVENDKIGRNKNSDRSTMLDLMRAVVKEQTEVFEGIERYEWYIMILSIQDNPIEFLTSILK